MNALEAERLEALEAEKARPLPGWGRIEAPNGDTYEGQYRTGKMHGAGTYTYSSGDVFEGEFEDDEEQTARQRAHVLAELRVQMKQAEEALEAGVRRQGGVTNEIATLRGQLAHAAKEQAQWEQERPLRHRSRPPSFRRPRLTRSIPMKWRTPSKTL